MKLSSLKTRSLAGRNIFNRDSICFNKILRTPSFRCQQFIAVLVIIYKISNLQLMYISITLLPDQVTPIYIRGKFNLVPGLIQQYLLQLICISLSVLIHFSQNNLKCHLLLGTEHFTTAESISNCLYIKDSSTQIDWECLQKAQEKHLSG